MIPGFPLHKTTKMLKNFKAKVAGLMAQKNAVAAGKGWWRLEDAMKRVPSSVRKSEFETTAILKLPELFSSFEISTISKRSL